MGPLLFVLYVNDLPKVVTKCTVNLYADDITVYVAHKCSNVVTGYLNEDLDRIANWVEKNELRINISKTKFMAIGTKDCEGGVKLQGSKIPQCPEIKYLGVVIDQKLTWQSHVASLRKKSLAMISTISRVKSCLSVRVRQLLYKSLVLPQLDYCPTVWHTNCSNELSTKIERLQNYAMRIILDEPPRTPSAALRDRLGWTSLRRRCLYSLLCMVHRCVLQQAPEELIILFTKNRALYTTTRGADKLHLPRPFTNKCRFSFAFQGALHYNLLPLRIRSAPSVTSFKLALTLTNNNLL